MNALTPHDEQHFARLRPETELYQGGAMAIATDAGKFHTVIVCAEELRPLDNLCVPRGVRLIDAGIDDAVLTPREAWIAENAAERAVRDLSVGRRVLVACFMGLNRSGLVSALALKRMGMTAEQAIETVRAARPGALSNRSFLRYLRA